MRVILFEPFRAVFYTGFYAAFAIGAFRDQGVDVEMRTVGDPAASTAGVLEGKAQVMWGGPMRLLLGHDRDPNSPLLGFAEVVVRDPFYLIGRRPNPSFRFSDLQGQRLGTVSEVPTPWECLQDDVRRAGMAPASLHRVSDRTMAQNADALRAGELDVIQVFEPFVEQLLREGAGHIWYTAATRGPCSYTTLVTSRQFAAAEPEVLRAMTRAIAKTLHWLAATDPRDVAKAVASYFPDLPQGVLAAALARYKANGLYGDHPKHSVTGFVRLKSALLSGGFINRDVPFDECIDTTFAEAI